MLSLSKYCVLCPFFYYHAIPEFSLPSKNLHPVPLSFNTDDFILKVSVPRVIENKEKVIENEEKLIENSEKLIEKLIEKSTNNGDKLTENRIAILRAITEDPYTTKTELSEIIGISTTAISANIEYMRGKYIRRVGPDKGGFWEIIK